MSEEEYCGLTIKKMIKAGYLGLTQPLPFNDWLDIYYKDDEKIKKLGAKLIIQRYYIYAMESYLRALEEHTRRDLGEKG